jgi:hypothetical protein
MAEVSRRQAGYEQNINNLKMQQMELEASRSQIQNIRNMQRARALGTAAAVNQGANKGSGLQGGLAQISNQAGWNMLGVNQALYTGRSINEQNNLISGTKMEMASLQGDMAQAQGMASLGGALTKSSGLFGQFAAGFGGMNLFPGVQLPGMK